MLSERRNERMAELFHRAHLIEKWGRGIKMILEKEPSTEFEEVGTHFITTFKRKYVEGSISEKEGDATQKTTQKILDEIKENPKITRKELAFKIGIGEDGIKFQLTKMVS